MAVVDREFVDIKSSSEDYGGMFKQFAEDPDDRMIQGAIVSIYFDNDEVVVQMNGEIAVPGTIQHDDFLDDIEMYQWMDHFVREQLIEVEGGWFTGRQVLPADAKVIIYGRGNGSGFNITGIRISHEDHDFHVKSGFVYLVIMSAFLKHTTNKRLSYSFVNSDSDRVMRVTLST